jgi:hypothetical protein
MRQAPAVGWIDLRDHGLPMAVAIAGAGYPLHVSARHPDSLDAIGGTPHVRHGEIRTLAAACDVVGLRVSTDIAACASRPGPFGSHRPTGASSYREPPRQGDCRSPSPGPGSQPEPGRQEEDHHRQADHPGRAQSGARGGLIRGLPVTGAEGESQPQLYRTCWTAARPCPPRPRNRVGGIRVVPRIRRGRSCGRGQGRRGRRLPLRKPQKEES